MLQIADVVPFSSIDFPGRLSAVLFCQGCPWKCVYCHNPHLRSVARINSIDQQAILGFLESRKGLLDAVVFSGGEPTLQEELLPFAVEIKSMGFDIGLHTAGIAPTHLERLLPLTSWVGLDIKGLPEDYESITAIGGAAQNAYKSLDLILSQGVACEVRTTYHTRLFPVENLIALGRDLSRRGVQCYVVQQFRPVGCVDENACSWTPSVLPDIVYSELSPLFESFSVR